jgi:hypothetical protein
MAMYTACRKESVLQLMFGKQTSTATKGEREG